MKSIIRTAVAIFLVAACIQVNHASAQIVQLAGWNVNGITTNTGGAGGPPPALFSATSFATNYVIAGNLSKGTNTPGIGTVTTGSEEYGGNDWYTTNESESNSIASGLAIEYAVSAAPGSTISFTENFLNYHNSATGPTNAALQYCTDGVSYSNIALITYAAYDTAATSTNIINLSTNAFLQRVPAGITNYFRIVNWGTYSNGTSGTWYIYNTVPTNAGLQLLGTVQADTQLASWNTQSLPDGAGGAPPALVAATTYATNYVIPGNLSKSTNTPGIQVVSTENEAYGGNGWYTTNESENNSISNGLFIAYSVAAEPGYSLSFNEQFLNYHNSATGPTNGALQYCTDGVSYSNIALITYSPYDTAATSTNILNLSQFPFLQNVPSTVTNYFRLVNWGTEGTGSSGTWYIYNTVPTNAGLQLIGAVQSVLAAWNVNGIPDGAGGAPPAPFAATSVAPNVMAGYLTKGTNPGPAVVSTEDEAYGGNGWNTSSESETNSIANGLYVAYSAQSEDGFLISFSDMVLNWHNSATGPTNGALQYCTDGVSYSNIYLISYAPYDTSETVTTNINLSTNAFLQNVPATVTNFFRIVNWGTEGTGSAGTWYIYNSVPANPGLQLLGSLVSFAIIAPTNLIVTPSNLVANANSTVEFTVSAEGSPASYQWYSILGSVTNLIADSTSATLTLTNVLGPNAGDYFVVLSNASGTATSSVATLSVVDPFLLYPPNNAEGFVGGQAQFSVTVAGSNPSLFWYQNNGSGNWTQIVDGSQPSGSTVSGSRTSLLTISDVQPGDTNDFAYVEAIVSDKYGTVYSSPASLLNASTNGSDLASYVFYGVQEITGVQDGLPYSGIIAQWDFNGVDYTNAQLNPPPYTGDFNPASPSVFFPPPWIGVGASTAVGCAFAPSAGPSGISPYDGPASGGAPIDGLDFTTNLPNGCMGTENYPLTGSNKLNGVQFMTSTVGAKNINVSYYLRETGTSSLYTRLQYTTNAGTDWTDYPSSTSFPGSDVNLFAPVFTYNLSGFPGAANNPDFGIRVVTEYQSTATYGIGSQGGNPLYITNGYVGCDNLYSSGASATTSAGTLTFDLVTIGGQPMNESIYSPPIISEITNANAISAFNTLTLNSVTNGESNYDFVQITNTFTIGSAITPVSELTVSAQSYNPNVINPGFSFTLDGPNVTMVITPNSIQDPMDAAPIAVTVTDTTTGDTTVEWFLLTLQSLNLPPTNTLEFLTMTNMLANSTLNIPFQTGSYDGTNTSPPVSYASNSLNNAVIPTTNLALAGEGTTNLVLSVTPAHNKLGQGVVTVTVNDGNPLEPRSATATIPITVRPNTNIVLIDYFNYDTSGPLEVVSAGFWSHLSGNENQLQVGNGLVPNSVTIDTLDYTENLQAPLLGAPYYTNSAASNTAPVLYASYLITLADSSKLPVADGAYVTAFDDGSGNTGTAHVECGLWVQTNGAAPGHYRLGISDFPAQEAMGVTYPQDLTVGATYVVVTALTLSNGFSTLWINPNGQNSSSVQDATTAIAAAGTNLNMSDFELRESGSYAGSVSLSKLEVGTTFDSVFPSLHIQQIGTNAVLTWSDPTLGIQATPDLLSPWVDVTNATSPYTNALGTNTEMYFKFGQ